jgi:hypothetical protein
MLLSRCCLNVTVAWHTLHTLPVDPLLAAIGLPPLLETLRYAMGRPSLPRLTAHRESQSKAWQRNPCRVKESQPLSTAATPHAEQRWEASRGLGQCLLAILGPNLKMGTPLPNRDVSIHFSALFDLRYSHRHAVW